MKLSLITINLNNKAGLQKTIESVISQTYKNIEFIVIDGGSNDGSLDVIKEHEEKISYWVSEKDKGIYNAMNKAIVKATGDYCFFLNSGDWLVTSDTLEQLFALQLNEDVVYGNVLKTDNASHKFVRDKSLAKSDLTLLDLYYNTLPHQSSFIKKTLFDKHGLYDETFKVVSDWLFFLKSIGVEGASAKYVDIDISYYDIRGFSSQNDSLRFEEKKAGRKKILPKQLYADYIYLDQLNKSKFKINFYDKLIQNRFLMLIIKITNRVFKLNLWKLN